jgi:hypothetical protein
LVDYHVFAAPIDNGGLTASRTGSEREVADSEDGSKSTVQARPEIDGRIRLSKYGGQDLQP